MDAFCTHLRRTRLLVPAHKRREIESRGMRHGCDKFIASHCLSIVTRKVDIHAAPKSLLAYQGVNHPHDFSAFFVHRRRIKIVYLEITGRSYRMRHWSCVFGELHGAQLTHILNPAGVSIVLVATEFLITKYRQAFLQGQLKPVATGHAISRPIVKIFVRHDAVDKGEISIRRRILASQNKLGVENIEALVFHGAAIEITDRNDHVMIQIAFETKGFFIPAH